jgi:hypothetical protein
LANGKVDTTVPTIAVTSSVSSLKASETATITFTLSESSTNFISTDVSATGGTLSSFSGSGTTYTATFTPEANSTTAGVVSVASSAFTDAGGNANADGSSKTFTVDTVRPEIAITTNKTSLNVGSTATLTFTLTESSSNFVEADVTLSSGTLSAFSGSGTSYTATYTPATNSTADAVVSVASSKFTDTAGNNNSDGSDANNSRTFTVDTVAPTIILSPDKTALKLGSTALINITLSETSTDFVVGDLTVTGGTLGTFNGSGKNYSVVFTPTSANGTVSVASNKFTDPSGNNNTDGSDTDNAIAFTYDSVTPTISLSSNKSSIMKAGDTATITFTLSENSTDFVATDLTVDGGTLTNFTGSDNSYTATFTPNSATGSVSVASDKFSDAAGNLNADGANANNTVSFTFDGTAPTLLSASFINSQIDLTYDSAISSTLPNLSAFVVKFNNTAITVNSRVLSTDSKTITLNFDNPEEVYKGLVAAVTVPAVQDAAGNSSTASTVNTNAGSPPTGAVTIAGTAAQGAELTVSDNIGDADNIDGAISYLWYKNDVATSVTGNTYTTLTQANVGDVFRVKATYKDGLGNNEVVWSSSTAATRNVNDAPTGSLTVTTSSAGMKEDSTLTAVTSAIRDEDYTNSTPTGFSYQWLMNNVVISGATNSTFLLTQTHVGNVITARVSYTDKYGNTDTVTSEYVETNTVANVEDAYTGDISIGGASSNGVKVGDVLQVSSTLADEDGIPTTGTGVLSYQWKADGVAITGATGTAYTVTTDSIGKLMSVTASFTDLNGTGVTNVITKALPTKVVGLNSTGTGAVTFSATQPKEGETVSAITTTMADADGLGVISLQWKSNGVALTGQTAETLTLTQDMVGKTITVVASYLDGQGFC